MVALRIKKFEEMDTEYSSLCANIKMKREKNVSAVFEPKSIKGELFRRGICQEEGTTSSTRYYKTEKTDIVCQYLY